MAVVMTKDKFLAYEKVRKGGKTNMFDVRTVIKLSKYKLTREDCLDIMSGDNYSIYYDKWIKNEIYEKTGLEIDAPPK